MSESKLQCPFCKRITGRDFHADRCPRSRKTQAGLVAALESLGRPKILWMKGRIMFMRNGSVCEVTNPGVPYVRQTPRRMGGKVVLDGKPWNAGGVPRGKDEAVKHFRREYFRGKI